MRRPKKDSIFDFMAKDEKKYWIEFILSGIVVFAFSIVKVFVHEMWHTIIATIFGIQIKEVHIDFFGGYVRVSPVTPYLDMPVQMALMGLAGGLAEALLMFSLSVIALRPLWIFGFGNLVYAINESLWLYDCCSKGIVTALPFDTPIMIIGGAIILPLIFLADYLRKCKKWNEDWNEEYYRGLWKEEDRRR